MSLVSPDLWCGQTLPFPLHWIEKKQTFRPQLLFNLLCCRTAANDEKKILLVQWETAGSSSPFFSTTTFCCVVCCVCGFSWADQMRHTHGVEWEKKGWDSVGVVDRGSLFSLLEYLVTRCDVIWTNFQCPTTLLLASSSSFLIGVFKRDINLRKRTLF